MEQTLSFADKVYPQLAFLFLIYLVVVFFVALDLWSGVRKARQAGQYRSSFGFRKTVAKLAQYLNLLLAVTGVDALQMLALHSYKVNLPLFPVLTLLAAVLIGFIEVKSIFEKAEDKERAKIAEAAKLAKELLGDTTVQNIASQVADYLKDAAQKTEVEPKTHTENGTGE
jgi:hypothetical protein